MLNRCQNFDQSNSQPGKVSRLFLAIVLPELFQARVPGANFKFKDKPHEPPFQHSAEECKAIAPTGPDIPDCKSKEVAADFVENIANPNHCHFKAPDCLPYWAILVLRVAVLPPADLDYMLQFMDHNQDRDMEGVEEQVSVL